MDRRGGGAGGGYGGEGVHHRLLGLATAPRKATLETGQV